MKSLAILTSLLLASCATAHPLGNHYFVKRYENSTSSGAVSESASESETTTSTLTSTIFVTMADGSVKSYESLYSTTYTGHDSASASATSTSDSLETSGADGKGLNALASLGSSASAGSSIASTSSDNYCVPTTVTVTVSPSASDLTTTTVRSTITIPVTAVIPTTDSNGSSYNLTASTDYSTVLENTMLKKVSAASSLLTSSYSQYSSFANTTSAGPTTKVYQTVLHTVTVTASN